MDEVNEPADHDPADAGLDGLEPTPAPGMKAEAGGIIKAREAIMAHTRGKRGVGGTIDCPICGKPGALSFTVAKVNGHVWAQCKSDGCVAWME